MSDERLGSNPLNWVTPDAAPAATAMPDRASAATTQPAPPACAAKAATRRTLFQPAGTGNEEKTMSKDKLKIKQTMDTSQVIAYLKDLADSLESGVIRAEGEDGALVLRVSDTMQVELKLARKKDKTKCEIELEWLDDGSRPEALKISGE
ncbi:amphi-Trp domain-containing protein [Desulfovibrio sp. Huiquan2017]|uniref:amphi-Trp domain-containing protein n=1 Tax=Desulfovibrio sp. Huiquan2017 TaxID=2816861 RepID=UPI001A91E85D|nr:amphi-Trp domain-containing protein [Desulfovibrio sp. Huiquan2017]